MIKRIFLVLLVGAFLTAGFFMIILYKIVSSHDTSISIKESANSYRFYASYTKNKSRLVQKYLDEALQTHTELRRSSMGAYVTLTDNTSFYIRTTPGRLLIKLDKNENSPASCERVKKIFEQVKIKLGED